uniref:AP2/ERF domain-containing protein n=1 Tax=Mucochytrium quahogii TaxID=96639 RepID=A0A7S2RTF1_9STRA|mmetsp:Transcript_19295/g.41691  ORF Transcript_19295/g.41691 Transcript_19295/m.41691 type:complete len:533 (+) Transcript_19295:240-1838(+)
MCGVGASKPERTMTVQDNPEGVPRDGSIISINELHDKMDDFDFGYLSPDLRKSSLLKRMASSGGLSVKSADTDLSPMSTLSRTNSSSFSGMLAFDLNTSDNVKSEFDSGSDYLYSPDEGLTRTSDDSQLEEISTKGELQNTNNIEQKVKRELITSTNAQADSKVRKVEIHKRTAVAAKQDPTYVPAKQNPAKRTKRTNSVSTKRRAVAAKRPEVAVTSMYRGVSFKRKESKWVGQIKYKGIQHYLGIFHTQEEAARAYDIRARRYYGNDTSATNFPSDEVAKSVCVQAALRNGTEVTEMDHDARKQPTSSYRGVSYKNKDQKWVAQIRHKNKQYYLGIFETEKEAALAYDTSARSYHGKRAKLNFSDEVFALECAKRDLESTGLRFKAKSMKTRSTKVRDKVATPQGKSRTSTLSTQSDRYIQPIDTTTSDRLNERRVGVVTRNSREPQSSRKMDMRGVDPCIKHVFTDSPSASSVDSTKSSFVPFQWQSTRGGDMLNASDLDENLNEFSFGNQISYLQPGISLKKYTQLDT